METCASGISLVKLNFFIDLIENVVYEVNFLTSLIRNVQTFEW